MIKLVLAQTGKNHFQIRETLIGQPESLLFFKKEKAALERMIRVCEMLLEEKNREETK